MKKLINQTPDRTFKVFLGLLPFVLMIVLYMVSSDARLEVNPNDKLLPSFSQIGDGLSRMALEPSKRTGDYVFWQDTASSLTRLGLGVLIAAAIGLFWFDENNTSVKAIEQDGTVNNVSLNYFDPTKSTIIHFHGWQNGSSQNNYSREDFLFDYNGENVITSASWKARDWNIAYFYWNQLADEAEVKDAEAKIWTPNGPRGMRYRLNDGSYSTALSPNKSVSDIAFEQITSVLSGSTSYYVRLSGHSLGSQLATNVTKKISDAVYNGTVGNNLTVDRLELLDPFWSADPKSYLGDANGDGNTDWVGEHARWDIQTLIDRHNLPVTWYKSSGILDIWIGDRNTILEGMVTFIHNRFWYL
ncbi:hypothetical protein, partial [Oleiphilus sp. HI0067]|uniref:hypothetical protein n=1 Tax=Oleiphilus sp. HI0067 TaxID=1822243 RepID=UPI0007C2FAFD